MRLSKAVVVVSLLSSFLWAQAPPAPSAGQTPVAPAVPQARANPEAEQQARAAAVPALAPVITLEGLCNKPRAAKTAKAPAAKTPCRTVVTRAQFERVLEAIVPPSRRALLPATAKQQIARQLAMLMVMATKAEQSGLARDATVEERIKLGREQALAAAYNDKLQDEAKPSPAAIASYYAQNPSAFDEVTLERVYIPKALPEKGKSVDTAAEKAAAEKLRQRAAAGEDFAKLEKELFAGQPNAQSAPTTEMGPRRRGALPADQEAAVFALKAGEVSPLLENPAGWYIYKVEKKRTLPAAEVQQEISERLQQEKYADMRTQLTGSVQPKLNDAYFGASVSPGMPMRAPQAAPAAPPPPKPKAGESAPPAKQR